MTEKEQAMKLVQKFETAIGISYLVDERKECARICCDEIITELQSIVFDFDMDQHFGGASPSSTTIPYWERVKQEIDKL